jgi:hypothetical protein
VTNVEGNVLSLHDPTTLLLLHTGDKYFSKNITTTDQHLKWAMKRFIVKEQTFLNALLCVQNIYLYHTSDDDFAVY